MAYAGRHSSLNSPAVAFKVSAPCVAPGTQYMLSKSLLKEGKCLPDSTHFLQFCFTHLEAHTMVS